MSDTLFGSGLRKNILIFAITIIGMSFVFQLVKMQILENKTYAEKSNNNSIKKNAVQAPRGIFFDRNFKVMVSNKPTYTIQIIPALYNKNNSTLIEDVFKLDSNYIEKTLYKKRGYSKYLPRTIKRNVPFNEITWIEENNENLPGVNIVVDMQRDYSFGINGSHIFGYLREISAKQLKDKKAQYSLGDFVGVSGVEKAYESYLKGKKGYEFLLVDARRKTIGKYLEGQTDILPHKGKDLVLSLDFETQKVAEELFKSLSGSLVAIEPNSGDILAYVSAPYFNLEDFASVISKNKINKLRTDPEKPLFDRASRSIYPPGSTYKMLAAVIGLEENLITENSRIICKGGYQYGDRFFRCHGAHGSVNVIESIEHSCNTFYYKLIFDIGLERWAKYLRMFGFGSPTGFDLKNEAPGIVPDADYYNKVYGKNKWSKGNLISLSIGQGEFSVTTLQLAQYTALLANYGKTKVPHIVKGYLDGTQNLFHPFKFKDKKIKISKKSFDIVREGMLKVVNGNGTATGIRLPNIKIAGKTGTSQNPHGKDHALFIGFAPYDNPQIAVAVMVENIGFGSTFAAPIAQKVIKTYLENLELDNFNLSTL